MFEGAKQDVAQGRGKLFGHAVKALVSEIPSAKQRVVLFSVENGYGPALVLRVDGCALLRKGEQSVPVALVSAKRGCGA